MIVAGSLLATLAVAVVFLLAYFGDIKRHVWYAQLIAFVAWYFPFAIIVVLPLDLASTLHTKCQLHNGTYTAHNAYNYSATLHNLVQFSTEEVLEICEEPIGYVSRDFLVYFWTAVYWTSQLLTWFVVPVMVSFVRSGDFAFWPKLKGAVKENAIFYAILGVLGVVFLIYMIFAIGFSTDALIAILMAAANAWGLLLCTCMLGYGLVEIPRDVWSIASPACRLKMIEIQAPKAKEKMIDSEAAVFEVARELAEANHQVPDTEIVLRSAIETMLKCCPLALDDKVMADVRKVRRNAKEVDLVKLKGLHARIKYCVTLYERHQAQYRFLLEKAWFLGDVVGNAKNSDFIFRSVFVKGGDTPLDIFRLRILWFWYLYVKPGLMYALSGIFILASIALIWSESTFQIKSAPLSIPALLLKNNFVSYASMEFIAISFLVYMCICSYSTLFKIKIFDYYVIVPEHCTDEPSLLFTGGYLCRLTFPLCYNFLNMISDDENSVFVEYQGKAIDLAPLLGDGFNTWVPLLVLIISTLTYFNLFGRISACFGGKSFMVSRNLEGMDADAVEGRAIISQARSQEERRSNGAFSTRGSDRLHAPGKVVSTQEFLAKYASGGPSGSTPSGTTAGQPPSVLKSSSTAHSATGSPSHVESSPATKIPSAISPSGGRVLHKVTEMWSGFVGKKDAGGQYQKLDVSNEDDTAVATVVPGQSGSYSFKMLNMGTGGSGPGTPTTKPNRVFGSNAANTPISTPAIADGAASVKPNAGGAGKKKNIFDDI